MERNRIVGVGLAAVILLALVVLGVSALSEQPAALDPDAPEGVVQAFVAAVTEERWSDARSHLDEELQERCSVSDLTRGHIEDVSRVVIDDVTRSDGTSVVTVVVTHASLDDPINPSSWDESVSFGLVLESGRWAIDDLSWPHVPCRWEQP